MSDEQYKKLITNGVTKINYYTALADAAGESMKQNAANDAKGYTDFTSKIRSAIQAEVEEQYQVVSIGQVDEVLERFFAISVERRVQHPVVAAVVDAARTQLFASDRTLQDQA